MTLWQILTVFPTMPIAAYKVQLGDRVSVTAAFRQLVSRFHVASLLKENLDMPENPKYA